MSSKYDDDDILLLTPDERAALTEAERQLLMVLTRSFTVQELSILTTQDLAFFLSLQHSVLPAIPEPEALDTARAYQERIRQRLASDRH